jgi:hypothetical protein
MDEKRTQLLPDSGARHKGLESEQTDEKKDQDAESPGEPVKQFDRGSHRGTFVMALQDFMVLSGGFEEPGPKRAWDGAVADT